MRYYSLTDQGKFVSFREAVMQGQAADGGLYFPERIPRLSKEWIKSMKNKESPQIAFEVMQPFIGKGISRQGLFKICNETFRFRIPVTRIDKRVRSQELFHGPTMAFKDVGASFMAGCLSWFVRDAYQEVVVLVATSGDTGAAVVQSFHGRKGIRVVVLYPSGKVSPFQELQIAGGYRNVQAIEVKGTFDDCQRMVKAAFYDKKLRTKVMLTSANSINIARWLPQQIFYFLAVKAWPYKQPPVISVPCGNFGNISAGLLARASGLLIKHFIAACNSNRVFTDYLNSGRYIPAPAIPTISNAMDVGNPSNFGRTLKLLEHPANAANEIISSISVNDRDTEEAIWNVYQQNEYLMDPHGAVAYCALRNYLDQNPGTRGLFLETAHPGKFETIMESITGKPVKLSRKMGPVKKRKKESIVMGPSYEALRIFLMDSKS